MYEYDVCDEEAKVNKTMNLIKSNKLKQNIYDFNINMSMSDRNEISKTRNPQLKQLNLDNGNLRDKSKLNQLLGNVDYIEQLTLRKNDMLAIPFQVQKVTNLKVLNVSQNQIKEIPTGFLQNFKYLEVLILNKNMIQNITDDIYQIKTLQILDISFNFVNQISHLIKQLIRLEVLRIHQNPLIGIPLDIFELNNLKILEIDWTKYTDPPLQQAIERPDPIFEKFSEFVYYIQQQNQNIATLHDFLKYFSTNSFNVLKTDVRGRNILHNAALNEENGVVLQIGKCFPELMNQMDLQNQTPFTLALIEQKMKCLPLLIQLGCDLNIGGGIYGSPLHLLAFNLEVKLLEQIQKQQLNIKKFDDNGNTPLHIVMNIFEKNPSQAEQTANLLMKIGCLPNIKNKDQLTPIFVAVQRNQKLAVKWVIMTYEFNYIKQYYYHKNDQENNIAIIELFLNSDQNYSQAIDYNIQRKKTISFNKDQVKNQLFNLNKRGGPKKWAPLHLAAYTGRSKIIEIMGLSGQVDFLQENRQGFLALQLSTHSMRNLKTVRKWTNHWIQKQLEIKNEKQVQPSLVQLIQKLDEIFLPKQKYNYFAEHKQQFYKKFENSIENLNLTQQSFQIKDIDEFDDEGLDIRVGNPNSNNKKKKQFMQVQQLYEQLEFDKKSDIINEYRSEINFKQDFHNNLQEIINNLIHLTQYDDDQNSLDRFLLKENVSLNEKLQFLLNVKIFGFKCSSRFDVFIPKQLPTQLQFSKDEIYQTQSFLNWTFLNFLSKIKVKNQLSKQNAYDISLISSEIMRFIQEAEFLNNIKNIEQVTYVKNQSLQNFESYQTLLYFKQLKNNRHQNQLQEKNDIFDIKQSKEYLDISQNKISKSDKINNFFNFKITQFQI